MANLNIRVSNVIGKFYDVKENTDIRGLYEVRDKNDSVLWYFFSSNNATYHSSGNDCVVRDIAQSNSSYIDRLKAAFEKAKNENKKIFWLVMVFGEGIGLNPTDYEWMASIEMKVDFDHMTKSLSMRTYPIGKNKKGEWRPCLKRVEQDKYFNCTFISCKDINDDFTNKYMIPYFEIYDNRPFHEIIPYDDKTNEKEISNKTDSDDFTPRSRKKHPLNCILYGAPGTGKTYSTAQYALAIAENKDYKDIASEERESVMKRYNDYIEEGKIVFTTFHQNYGYEDFIQGIRPDTKSENMTFKPVDGVFKVIADRALKNPGEDFIIIIDEINRANISKVFGELITLIEEDKRWGEINAIKITLPSGDPFKIPNNLYILGTMNSADKSISLIDTALRRRFDFIECTPKAELIADTDLRNILIKLNNGISSELKSTDLLIGHSYFINKDIDDLCSIMNRNIIPLLYEYFFDNQKKVENHVKNATEGYNVEVSSSGVGRIKLIKKEI